MAHNSPRVFVDTSGFKALLDTSDDFHGAAKEVWSALEKERVRLVVSNYIIDECLTLLRVRAGKELAFSFRDFISQEGIQVVRVTLEDEKNAWSWFEKDWSRLSFTDCVTFAQLERLGIGRVFSFDSHFKRAGFGVA